ncbi:MULTISPECIES: urease accessory protein UreD [unclassified Campylobacter]|uniref:urease accessory protein UreD n=1 Tax=unclassified Campylobacter TaxID=2593542 RepID=UPI001BDAFF44|nr:urease accessory protein UreD [Campylobacter sp. 2018MI01]MBZ7975494.1 urease accessory protein UreD [Campylobacter sp. RM12637]MBZ7984450.1 urease accessory protein UreD [Campylobacter sp. RM12647]MBZ7993328.1 urease accessory protein UreD [Campylobacter sp. RM9333]
MSLLKITLENNHLKEHYQQGMQRLIQVPTRFGEDSENEDFFAYLSTLGGGFVNQDNYAQSFKLVNSKATLSSQSNQKIYKGTSSLKTNIELDNNSILVFHNDANIFYQNSNFSSKTTIFMNDNSRLFYLDGGFLGYANSQFKAKLSLRIFINNKLSINDIFYYNSNSSLNSLYNHNYFYTLIIKGDVEFKTIHNENLKAHSSIINNTNIIRISSDDNDLAMKYINDIKSNFLHKGGMKLILARQ